jgi:hypothetical protein
MTTQTIEFELVEDWEQKPDDIQHKDVAAVAVDSQGRVYLHTRHDDQTLVYDGDGNFIQAWGLGVFGNAHGITIGPDDSVWCVDNRDHVVRKFTTDGELLQTLGTPGVASETGYGRRTGDGPAKIHHNETIQQVAGPFNSCTNIAIAPNGELYVADGYGNARVHRFTAEGELIQSWGEIGTEPGEFHLPHGIWVDRESHVIVADRENDRLQFFNADGEYLDMWTDVLRPTQVIADDDGYVYVSELWRPCEPGQGSFVHGLATEDMPGRVSVFDASGRVVARWGADSDNRCAPGNFIAPHDLTLDGEGNLYVAEVAGTFGVSLGRVGPECADHQIQKFRRK